MVTTYSTTKEDGTDWSWQNYISKNGTSPSTSPWPQCSTYSPRMTHRHTMDRIHCHTDPPTSKIYNFKEKKVVAKTTYDRDRGIAAIVLQKGLMDIAKANWHEGWKEAHRDHSRYAKYSLYPYAISIAEARLEEEREEMRNQEWLKVTQVAAKEATKKGTKDATVHREATNKATMQETTRKRNENKTKRQGNPSKRKQQNARSKRTFLEGCPGKVPAGTSSSPSLHRCWERCGNRGEDDCKGLPTQEHGIVPNAGRWDEDAL